MANPSPDFWKWRLGRTNRAAPTPVPEREFTDRTAQDVYAGFIKDVVSPALRAEALTGSSGRYSMKSDTHWALLGFQKSSYSDRHELRFTINLLVVARAEWEDMVAQAPYFGKRPTPTANYPKPAHHTRIGKLVGNGGDKWWRVSPDENLRLLEVDVLGDIRTAGLPWMREQLRLDGDNRD